MKAYDVIGYGFDGAIYCPDHVPTAKETGCTCGETDENGSCLNNCHGYGPNPIFAGDAQTGDACDEPDCGYLAGCEPEEEPEDEEDEEEEALP